MIDTIFGGDINLFSVEKSSWPRLDEPKLEQAMHEFTESGDYSFQSIESFVFNSGSVRRQLYSTGEDQIKEFIKGDGLVWSKSRIGNIYSQSVAENLVETLRIDQVWWPGIHLQ